jgi:hypothetical protein
LYWFLADDGGKLRGALEGGNGAGRIALRGERAAQQTP